NLSTSSRTYLRHPELIYVIPNLSTSSRTYLRHPERSEGSPGFTPEASGKSIVLDSSLTWFGMTT
ncbi:hypothetical protein, partial [Legionella maioricensis]